MKRNFYRALMAMVLLMGMNLVANAQSFKTNGHTYTQKGTLTIKAYNASATGTVTFTNVPTNYEEFEEVYTKFLGKTPYGTAAMMPMAMAIYGRDRAEGEKCIRLINYPSNVNSVLSQLKEKFGTSQYAPENDSYHQPYLPAAVLEGATPQNAYAPNHPYTVNMRASVNKHQDMQLYDGRVMQCGNHTGGRRRFVQGVQLPIPLHTMQENQRHLGRSEIVSVTQRTIVKFFAAVILIRCKVTT